MEDKYSWEGIKLVGSAKVVSEHKWGDKASKPFSKLKFDNLFLQKVRAFTYEIYK